ncbi:MAG TPA: LamG-like jellyroll fold domain-containing protein, partial [Bryobacteraceae bacterium]|nr:LamG-like jellyroll fold domain-containing protein [Bryobacteraceae bacterium]
SFSQRLAAGGTRVAFDVQDTAGHNVYYFLTQTSSGFLTFSYNVGGGAQFYYAPSATEDTLFGSGVILKVAISWDGSISKLYLNDTLVQSSPYTPPAPNWSSASVFDLGALDYAPYGGVDASSDIIDEFTVYPSATP